MPRPFGWTAPAASASAAAHTSANSATAAARPPDVPPSIEARHLVAQTLLSKSSSTTKPNAEWPLLVHDCMQSSLIPCPAATNLLTELRGLHLSAQPASESVVAPLATAWLATTPPDSQYQLCDTRTPSASGTAQHRDAHFTPAPLAATTAAAALRMREAQQKSLAARTLVPLGSNMQPSLSRRRSGLYALPQRSNSIFPSKRRSSNARIALAADRQQEEFQAKEKEGSSVADKEQDGIEQNQPDYQNGNHNENETEIHIEADGQSTKKTDQEKEEDASADQIDPIMDLTIHDAADIKKTDDMNDAMLEAQQAKEMRPRNFGSILNKMHTLPRDRGRAVVVVDVDAVASGDEGDIEDAVTETNHGQVSRLPPPTDTAYARDRARGSIEQRKREQAVAAKERERVQLERIRERSRRKRKRKRRAIARKKGEKYVDSSDDQEDSVSAATGPDDDPPVPNPNVNAGDHDGPARSTVRDSTPNSAVEPGARNRGGGPEDQRDPHDPHDPKRRRPYPYPLAPAAYLMHPQRYPHPSPHLTYPTFPYSRQPPLPSRGGGDHGEAPYFRGDGYGADNHGGPPSNQSPSHGRPSHASYKGSYSSPPAPPPGYFSHGPPPSFFHGPSYPPNGGHYPYQQPASFYAPSGPPPPERAQPKELERRRNDLWREIDRIAVNLHQDDLQVIDDFLDNQDYMFRNGPSSKYILLQRLDDEEVLLRLDSETRKWKVIHSRS